MCATGAKLAETRDDQSGDGMRRKFMVDMIDAQIGCLKEREKILEATDQQRMDYRSSAAVIPSQEASDRLMRFEAYSSRELDRTLSQLERLQRIRKGQPVLPPIKVEVSS